MPHGNLPTAQQYEANMFSFIISIDKPIHSLLHAGVTILQDNSQSIEAALGHTVCMKHAKACPSMSRT